MGITHGYLFTCSIGVIYRGSLLFDRYKLIG